MEDKQWRVEKLSIHGSRILNENGSEIVRDIYDDTIAAQIVSEHNAHHALSRLASALWLHYNKRTDLDPIQQRLLELAIEARDHVAEKEELSI